MDAIKYLLEVDYFALVLSIFGVLIGIKAATSIFEWIIDKLGLETKWTREKKKDKELLIKTSENLSLLQEKHVQDVNRSIEHDEKIEKTLNDFIVNMKSTVNEMQTQILQFSENRVHDREQSFSIQKGLTDSQKELNESQKHILDTVDDIQKKLNKMKKDTDLRFEESEKKENARKMAELKDKISQSYRYYHAKKEITSMEFESLDGLIKAYELYNNNSFVHSIVEKERWTWKIVDE